MKYHAMFTYKEAGKLDAVKKRRLGTFSMSCHGVEYSPWQVKGHFAKIRARKTALAHILVLNRRTSLGL